MSERSTALWLGVITLFPEMFEIARAGGVFARAVDAGRLALETFNPREFATDKHRTVDDAPYGGGAGMVMMVEPLAAAWQAAQKAAPEGVRTVLMSPQGRRFTQADAVTEAAMPGLILVCGRYEGIDERFVTRFVDEEWSIGDYVLSGGELPAMVVADAIARHVPGVLGNQLSKTDESHLDGWLDYPHYTRPEQVAEAPVPDVLLSGDHGRVSEYRRREAIRRTVERRPDLLVGRTFSAEERRFIQEMAEAIDTPNDRAD